MGRLLRERERESEREREREREHMGRLREAVGRNGATYAPT
jgi:hypothetical protein